MTALLAVSCLLAWALTIHSWFNRRYLIACHPREILQSIAVLIPARNEERHIASCVTAALAQKVIPHLEIVVLNDNSTDSTAQILSTFHDSRLSVIDGAGEPPSGWLGKPYACHQLSNAVTSEFLVFIDADVVLSPHAVSSAVATLQDKSLDLICPYPRQIASTFLARLVQPLLQWSWLTTVPLKISLATQRPSMAVGNGQFIAVKRDAYVRSGGHEGVRNEVLEDIALSRNLSKNGFKATVVDGTTLATCNMYETNSQLISGYAKSLWSAFNGLIGTIFINLSLVFIYVAPLYGFASGQRALALVGYSAGVVGRLVCARQFQHRVFPDALLHPLSISSFVFLNAVSWIRHARGTNTWKGRVLHTS